METAKKTQKLFRTSVPLSLSCQLQVSASPPSGFWEGGGDGPDPVDPGEGGGDGPIPADPGEGGGDGPIPVDPGREGVMVLFQRIQGREGRWGWGSECIWRRAKFFKGGEEGPCPLRSQTSPSESIRSQAPVFSFERLRS